MSSMSITIYKRILFTLLYFSSPLSPHVVSYACIFLCFDKIELKLTDVAESVKKQWYISNPESPIPIIIFFPVN